MITVNQPTARVVHSIPGRIRVRVEDNVEFDRVQRSISDGLSGATGVKALEARPLPRSIIIHYGAEDAEVRGLIERKLAELGVQLLTEAKHGVAYLQTGTTAIGRDIVNTVTKANASLGGATGGRLDLRELFPLSLLALGVWEVIRGRAARMPWYNLVFYGYTIFFTLHSRRNSTGFNAGEILRQRYVKGEIDETEYRAKLQVIVEGGQNVTATG